MIMSKENALWRNHALLRAAEYHFSCDQLFDSWNRSILQELSDQQKAYKFKKYGMKSLRDRFYWDQLSSILFTVMVSEKGQWYVQTVTKGRGNWCT